MAIGSGPKRPPDVVATSAIWSPRRRTARPFALASFTGRLLRVAAPLGRLAGYAGDPAGRPRRPGRPRAMQVEVGALQGRGHVVAGEPAPVDAVVVRHGHSTAADGGEPAARRRVKGRQVVVYGDKPPARAVHVVESPPAPRPGDGGRAAIRRRARRGLAACHHRPRPGAP